MKTGYRAAAVAVLLAGGCQDYLFDQKCAEGLVESEVSVPAATPTPADILFVVDNSGSMADEQQKLADNFESFINQVAGTGDYRIAIVTTDLDSGSERYGLVLPHFSSGPWAYRDFLQDTRSCTSYDPSLDHGCFRYDPTDSDQATIIDSNALSTEEQIALFQRNVLVGSCGSGKETGLEAMRVALQPGGCNSDFLRNDANLVVVFVSDEDDFTPEEGGPEISDYVDFLATIKDLSQIRVATIVASQNGVAMNCNNSGGECGLLCEETPPEGSNEPCVNGACSDTDEYCNPSTDRCEHRALIDWFEDDRCNWCSYYNVEGCCSARAGTRYVEFARAIETAVTTADPLIIPANCNAPEGQAAACLIDSICQDDFSQTLERIARELVIATSYQLDPPAQNSSGVVVTLRGGRFPQGEELSFDTDFIIDAEGRTLRLTNPDKQPAEGESVELKYISTIERPTEPHGACGPQ